PVAHPGLAVPRTAKRDLADVEGRGEDEPIAEDADRRVQAEPLVERGPGAERPGSLARSVGRPEQLAGGEERLVARARERERRPGLEIDVESSRRADLGRAGRGAVRGEEPRPPAIDQREEDQPVS